MNEASISHQSFGEKKLTGHLTWQLITDDVRQSWPQYLDIALGTFALQDMYLLGSASQCGYKKCEIINILQNNIKANLHKIRNTRKISLKNLLYANLISRFYWYGKFYYKLHNLKMILK